MWIKDENGKLHNLEHIQTLEVDVATGGHVVKARFADTQVKTAELTYPNSKAEARKALNLIGEALRNADSPQGLLDLNNIQHLASEEYPPPQRRISDNPG